MYNTTVTLKKGEGRTLKAGGMWVFDNEIASILGTFENGDIVNIHDFDGYFMGYGYINTNSKITLRLLARRKDTVIDEAFFEQRVRDAWNYRKETIDTFNTSDTRGNSPSRLAVLRDRRKVAELTGDDINSDRVMAAIAGGA
mgnify:CR=1 FL=1